MNVADKTSFDSFLERNRTFLDRAFVYARVEFAQFLVELAFDAKGKKPHTTFVIIIFLFKREEDERSNVPSRDSNSRKIFE